MRKAAVILNGIKAAEFIEHSRKLYEIKYLADYKGNPISLTLPIQTESFMFNQFPHYLDGVLPEGSMLDALLRTKKIDRDDLFSQLVAVGEDLVGHITVKEEK
jgi:serine/threonine-protein kinase HipA